MRIKTTKTAKKLAQLVMLGSLALLSSVLAAVSHEECSIMERPKIESYSDYDTFMVDIIRYKKKQRECERFIAENPPEPEEPPRPNESKILISSETGKEDLTASVQLAKTYELPSYTEKLVHNRTTSQSFALPSIRTLDMASEFVTGALSEENLVDQHIQQQAMMNAQSASNLNLEKEFIKGEYDRALAIATKSSASNGGELCDSDDTTCVLANRSFFEQAEFVSVNPAGAFGYVLFDAVFRECP